MWRQYFEINRSWVIEHELSPIYIDGLVENWASSFWIFNYTINGNKSITLCRNIWPRIVILCSLFKFNLSSFFMYWWINSSFYHKNWLDHRLDNNCIPNFLNCRFFDLQKMRKERNDRINLYKSKWACSKVCYLSSATYKKT